MNTRSRSWTWGLGPLIAVAMACGHSTTTSASDKEYLVAQVCLPNHVVKFEELAVELPDTLPSTAQSIRASGTRRLTAMKWVPGSGEHEISDRSAVGVEEVLKRNGILSMLRGSIGLAGETDRHQPVFQNPSPSGPQDYVALAAIVPHADEGPQGVKYWFKVPDSLRLEQFTSWEAPISREGKEERNKQKNPTFWNLTHGRPMDVFPVGENAPKMRFLRTETLRRTHLPAKLIADRYFPGAWETDSQHLVFIEKPSVPIPSC
jgi:hypothetical protein